MIDKYDEHITICNLPKNTKVEVIAYVKAKLVLFRKTNEELLTAIKNANDDPNPITIAEYAGRISGLNTAIIILEDLESGK